MRRNLQSTPRLIGRRKSEGRGSGRGANYKPELYIHDVPSQGLATRIQGWKTNRTHHLLSKLELHYFYLLEWSPIITDIREQYPLGLEETLAIAEQLGIRHPTDPRSKYPIVMTTDFIITIPKNGSFHENARTVKYSKELSSMRVIEKYEIERLYWQARGVDWGIVTEKDIPRQMASNVEWIHPYKHISSLLPLKAKTVSKVEEILSSQVNNKGGSLRNLTDACDESLGLPTGSSLGVVRYLIATKRWHVDMTRPIRINNPIPWTVM